MKTINKTSIFFGNIEPENKEGPPFTSSLNYYDIHRFWREKIKSKHILHPHGFPFAKVAKAAKSPKDSPQTHSEKNYSEMIRDDINKEPKNGDGQGGMVQNEWQVSTETISK